MEEKNSNIFQWENMVPDTSVRTFISFSDLTTLALNRSKVPFWKIGKCVIGVNFMMKKVGSKELNELPTEKMEKELLTIVRVMLIALVVTLEYVQSNVFSKNA